VDGSDEAKRGIPGRRAVSAPAAPAGSSVMGFTLGRELYILARNRPTLELEDVPLIIPLDRLINEESNIYELTAAAIRRAYQITVTGDEELETNQGKVVSTAIKQVLTRKVEYQIEE
jgi:DNA-directed RNA polymerase subunit omega